VLAPEPLRCMVMQGILGYLAGLDRRVDRELRAAGV
jgi:hypothetical protein